MWAREISSPRVQWAVVIGLLLAAVLLRLAPHPANVAPIGAIALFGGAVLPTRFALTLPLAAMVVSDFFIGFHPLVWATWGSFALIALGAHLWLRRVSVESVFVASIGAAVLFFVVTNFAVWLEGRLYEPTLSGLAQSYYNALPFFRNSLLGDIAYSGALFGVYAWVMQGSERPLALSRLRSQTSSE